MFAYLSGIFFLKWFYADKYKNKTIMYFQVNWVKKEYKIYKMSFYQQ